MRLCPFHGCPEKIAPDKFACARHWFSLDRRKQQTILAAYADYEEERIGIEALRQVQQQVLGERGDARRGDSAPGATS